MSDFDRLAEALVKNLGVIIVRGENGEVKCLEPDVNFNIYQKSVDMCSDNNEPLIRLFDGKIEYLGPD